MTCEQPEGEGMLSTVIRPRSIAYMLISMLIHSIRCGPFLHMQRGRLVDLSLGHRRRLPYRAMVATAPGEKTPHAVPPCEELDPPYDIMLVFVQKITFALRKISKDYCPQSCTF